MFLPQSLLFPSLSVSILAYPRSLVKADKAKGFGFKVCNGGNQGVGIKIVKVGLDKVGIIGMAKVMIG